MIIRYRNCGDVSLEIGPRNRSDSVLTRYLYTVSSVCRTRPQFVLATEETAC